MFWGIVDVSNAVMFRGCKGGRRPLLIGSHLVVEGWSRTTGSIREGVFLHVAEEQEGGMHLTHCALHVFGLQENGVRGQAPGEADVSR